MSTQSSKAVATAVSVSVVSFLTAYYLNRKIKSEAGTKMTSDSKNTMPTFVSKSDEKLCQILKDASSILSDEGLIKITRQLEFWSKQSLPSSDFLSLAQRLVDAAKAPMKALNNNDTPVPKIPTMRFGRTEINMPIVTTGGMRCQMTWLPDNLPVSFSKKKTLGHASQAHLKDLIRFSLKLGMNHFETARMYGTSEMQFAAALNEMIESGEIKRSDFILQTKIQPTAPDAESFQKIWDLSWGHFKCLEYIDLFAFHCISSNFQADDLLQEGDDTVFVFVRDLQKQGIIKHIGFSTHGDGENIYKLVASNQFDFVNIHCHYFGSYHAEGTPDTCGGHGNLAAVKKARELDMGVFLISPYDKGGALYKPSKPVALAVGDKMTPMSFASLYAWDILGFHTISVGVSKVSDFVECYEAAMLYENRESTGVMKEVNVIDDRLKTLAVEKLGQEWVEKGLLNIPSFYEESSNGIGLGHTLWCYNVLKAYGLYDFGKERYSNMETFYPAKSWKQDKAFAENAKTLSNGNPGRCFDGSIDIVEVLKDHYNPELAKERIMETIELLGGDAKFTDEDRKKHDAEVAYDLSSWEDFPGRENVSFSAVIKQMLTRNYFGPLSKTGPNSKVTDYGASLRQYYEAL